MTLLTPAWLWLLLPWTALLVYLLGAAGRDVAVPFVDLWKKDSAPAHRRSTRLPPLHILLLMIALLLAILAAAQPVFPRFRPSGVITVIVDTGSTMSRRALREAVDDTSRAMLDAGMGMHRLRLLILPGDRIRATDVSDWTSFVRDLAPLAIDTRPALLRAVRHHLASSNEPLLVISNQPLPVDAPRLAHITPATPISNAGIERLGIGLDPHPQVMVRLLNQSPHTSAALRLHLDDAPAIERAIELPPQGEAGNLFIDLPAAPQALWVELLVDDDLAHDNHARAQRQGAWPRIEAVGPLPPELSRMLAVYARHRPPGPNAPTIVLTTDPARLPSAVTGAVATAAPGQGAWDPDSPTLSVAAHAVTREIDWTSWLAGKPVMPSTSEPLAAEMQPLVSLDGQTLLAARQAPARQVWLAFDTSPLADTPEYVILWTNIFTWLGGDGVSWRVEATARRIEPAPLTDWRSRLIALSPSTGTTSHLTPALLIATLAAALAAIVLLPSRRSA